MSVSQADPRSVAGKIASAHNAHECRVCKRPITTGVYAFGLSGSDARWYPDEETAARDLGKSRVRILFPISTDDVTPEQVLARLEAERDELEQLIEYVEQQREERRLEREIRADNHGFRTDPYPCADCAKYGVRHLKHRPADICDRCGDEPCPVGIDPHDYNRGYGYRD